MIFSLNIRPFVLSSLQRRRIEGSVAQQLGECK